MNAPVVISQKDDGTWSLKVDGQDIANEVSACIVQIDGVGKPAQVRLELVDLAVFQGRADVVVDDRLAAILVKLGWKAPE